MTRSFTAMNNPSENLTEEVPFLLSCGLDGIEISAEDPNSSIALVNQYRSLIQPHIKIGHTRDDLKLASKDKRERVEAIELMEDALNLFKSFGVEKVNIHPHRGSPNLTKEEIFALNVESLNEVALISEKLGIKLMLENQPPFVTMEEIKHVIDQISPPIFLLLDLAHAFCYAGDKGARSFITDYYSKIEHIHISDNGGTSDDHLFPRKGIMNFAEYASLINQYVSKDVAISLESFRIKDNGELRIVTDSERAKLVPEAISYLQSIF